MSTWCPPLRPLRWHAALLGLALLAGPWSPARAGDEGDRFGQALAAYERCHWPQAYALLATLADEGHADAARLALQMVRHGTRLFGQRFEASAIQQARWLGLQPLPEAAVAAR